MKKFKYSVQSYLNLVKQKRETALKDLHKAQAYKRNLEERYEYMDSEIKNALTKNSEFGKNLQDLNYVNDNNQFIELIKVQMKSLSEEIAIAEENYQEKYKALLKLQTEVRKFELHKEEKQKEYKKAYNKKQQKISDDLNSTKKRGRNAKSI